MNPLKERTFEVIPAMQWKNVFLSLIREAAQTNAAYEKKQLPSYILELPNLGIAYTVARSSRGESNEKVQAALFFKDALPTDARGPFAEGFNLLAEDCYVRIKKGDSDAMLLLTDALFFNSSFGGLLEAKLSQLIALDKGVDVVIRASIAHDLINRDFKNSVGQSFWDALIIEVPQEPLIASPVIEWYVSTDQPLEAFEVLTKFRPTQPEDLFGIEYSLRKAVVKIRMYGWENHLQTIFEKYPGWANKFFEESVLTPDDVDIAMLMG